MKKKCIPALFRTVLMVVLIVIVLTLGVVMFMTWKNPGVVEEKIPLYSYSHKANIDYQANYRSNILTDSTMVGAGEIYITEYLRNILTTLNYEFIGEKVVEYKGQYTIKASLVGSRMEQNEIVRIWQKDYDLVPATSFEGTDASVLITKELPISLQQYNDFAERFSKETKISTETNLIINWHIEIEAVTERGIISEKLVPTMIIPINKSYFNISGEPQKEKSGVIEETITRILPVNTGRIYLSAVGIILSLALLVLLYFYTEGSRITNLLELKTREIFKKHGERLIALGGELPSIANQQITVLSLEDLIRIADELSKPVFYKADPAQETVPIFYVFDDPKVYLYKLVVEENKTTMEPVVLQDSIITTATKSEEA